MKPAWTSVEIFIFFSITENLLTSHLFYSKGTGTGVGPGTGGYPYGGTYGGKLYIYIFFSI